VLYQQVRGNRKTGDRSECNTEARPDAPSKIQWARAQSRVNDASLPDTVLPVHIAVDTLIRYRSIQAETEVQ
jgi:hypothetical protein